MTASATLQKVVEEYCIAATERRSALLNNRTSLVSPSEVLDLATRLEEAMGADVVDFADFIIDEKIKPGPSKLPEVERRALENARRSAAEAVEPSIATAIEHYVDASLRLSQRRSTAAEDRGRAAAVDLGTWKEDARYSRGDMVTRNGLLWHCEVPDTNNKPGDSSDWKMMHKSMERERYR
jgi:hypothetical protein